MIELDPTRYWECPSCGGQTVTRLAKVHTPMHACAQLAGILAPYVQVRSNAGLGRSAVRHVVRARDDYVGAERGLRYSAEGVPVMSVITERGDGSNDCHVFPAVAVAGAAANQ